MSGRRVATGLAFAAFLLLLVWARLFGALVSALLAYSLFDWLLGLLGRRLGRTASVALALAATVGFISLLVVVALRWADLDWPDSPQGVMTALAGALDELRERLPQGMSSRLPSSVEDFQQGASAWLRGHAHQLEHWGHSAVRGLAHVVLGVIAGLLFAFETPPAFNAQWARDARDALRDLARGFSQIVAAQVRIAAANAALTALFLGAVMPIAGMKLPYTIGLVALTLGVGIIPIIGNLISSAAVVLVALTVSPAAAGCALVFLIALHKLEYVLNGQFMGRSTHVPAAVLVSALIVFEALFGLMGLIAAPIYCAWAFRFFEITEDRAVSARGKDGVSSQPGSTSSRGNAPTP